MPVGTAGFAARVRYEGDPSGPPDLIHDAMLKILLGEVELPVDSKKARLRLLNTMRNVARSGYRTAKVREVVPLDGLRASPERLRDGSRNDKGFRRKHVGGRARGAVPFGVNP